MKRQELIEKICDEYCKMPDKYLELFEDSDLANTAMLESVCADCPLNELMKEEQGKVERRRSMKCLVEVNNVPETAAKYIVARFAEEDCKLWYWGSFATREKAEEVAAEIGGLVVERCAK